MLKVDDLVKQRISPAFFRFSGALDHEEVLLDKCSQLRVGPGVAIQLRRRKFLHVLIGRKGWRTEAKQSAEMQGNSSLPGYLQATISS